MIKKMFILLSALYLSGCSVTFTVLPGFGTDDHEVLIQETSHAKV